MIPDQHWSEASGEWYYVCDVSTQFEMLSEIEAEDLTNETNGMHILRRDGTATPAPTTRAAWLFLANMVEEDEDGNEDAVCVGKVVNGMCVSIGTFDDDGILIREQPR